MNVSLLRLKENSKGQSLVEFALILTPLLLVVFSIIQLGLIFNGQVTLTTAVREGVRTAAVGTPEADVRQRIVGVIAPTPFTSIHPVNDIDIFDVDGEVIINARARVVTVVPLLGIFVGESLEITSVASMRIEGIELYSGADPDSTVPDKKEIGAKDVSIVLQSSGNKNQLVILVKLQDLGDDINNIGVSLRILEKDDDDQNLYSFLFSDYQTTDHKGEAEFKTVKENKPGSTSDFDLLTDGKTYRAEVYNLSGIDWKWDEEDAPKINFRWSSNDGAVEIN